MFNGINKLTNLVTNSYNLFAEDTLARFSGLRKGSPLGCDALLSGTGPRNGLPLESRIMMVLARLHVPHGGAMKTPASSGG